MDKSDEDKHFVFNYVVEKTFMCTTVDKVSVSLCTLGTNKPRH